MGPAQYYTLFGKVIQSDITLPLKKSASASEEPFLTFTRHSSATHANETYKDYRYYSEISRENAVMHVNGLATFIISNGRHIAVTPDETALDTFTLSITLLGAPTGIALYQSDYFVLHGNAVHVHGKTAVILGHSGAGKSTTTLSLLDRGHKLLTDDITCINNSANPAHILPTYPWIKINNTLKDLFDINEQQTRKFSTAYSEKMLYQLDDSVFENTPSLIDCIYIPQWGDEITIERLSPKDALLHISEHAFGPMPRTKYPKDTKEYFLNCARLSKVTPCYIFTRPKNLDQLYLLTDLLEEHLAKQ